MSDEAQPRAEVALRIFGSTSVYHGDEPVSVGGPRQRRLLALLAVRAGAVVRVDWLAEHLWERDDRPEAAAPAIRTYMSRLRQALPDEAKEWITTEPGGYRLTAPTEVLEHRRFLALRAAATAARDVDDLQTALTLLHEALALWRGDPFTELEDLEWAQADIAQLQLDRLEMLEERWETLLALGRHTQITGELAAFTAQHGLRDRAARQHGLALHRSGRTAEALRALDQHRRLLADESGLEPSPALVELESQLLQGDALLDVDKAGRPLRGYRLLNQIGTGAFSIVWRAEQPSVGREVAIKQIRAELASQPEFIRRFEAEAHLVARIEHPHIVPLIDFWRDPDSAYLVMRSLKGGTLERLLDDGPLSIEQTLTLAHQVGGALGAAHAVGVIHRDVKTANILFDEQNNAFLTDFGIALEAANSSGPEAALSPGSPLYASPEQIRRERLGPEADVFSLGVVIFECLSGSLPFPSATSDEQLLELQLQADYPQLAELRTDVPEAVSSAVARATAKDPADRYPTVAAFVEALHTSNDRGATPMQQMGLVQQDLTNPYKGLRAFHDGDHGDFFGRERAVTELLERLAGDSLSSRCLVVVGPSGSGKSSLVRAGLVPALRTGSVRGSDDWFVATMVPGIDPFESLEAALLRVAVNPPSSLVDQLRENQRGMLRSVRRCLGSDDDVILLVIDQFEELFTGASPADADAFLTGLATAVQDPTSPLRVVVTLRADFYHRPLAHPAFAQIVKAAGVSITPLAPDELERAIVEPARRMGLEFEPGLVARMAAETAGQVAPLPLLQYALAELFERRSGHRLTVAAYNEIGEMSGALATRAENLYHESDAAGQQAARRIFGQLIDPEATTADLRRRVPIADLGSDAATSSVLERFGAARLITFDRDVLSREPTVEVAHEALLREWPRLTRWLDEDRDLLRSALSVGTAATAWDEGGRADADLYRGERLDNAAGLAKTAPQRFRPLDINFIEASRQASDAAQDAEAKQVRRLRRLVAGVGAALVVALIAGGLAVREQRRADDERDVALAAVESSELASMVSRSAALAGENPTLSLLLALEAHRRSPSPETQQAVLLGLGSAETANKVASYAAMTSEDCSGGFLPSNGMEVFFVVDGVPTSQDLSTGATTRHRLAEEPCLQWFADAKLDRRIDFAPDGQTIWLGPYNGPWELEKTFDEPRYPVFPSLLPNNVLVLLAPTPNSMTFHLVDARTGEPVAQPIQGGLDFLGAVEASDDGSRIALASATPQGANGDGHLTVVDGTTGETLVQLDTPLPATRMAFDQTSTALFMWMIDGAILTVDLETGNVVGEVSTSLASDALELHMRPDGLLVGISAGAVELIDPRTGPVGDSIDLRNVVSARYRPDGLITAITTDDSIAVFDIESTALVETVWDMPTSEAVGIRAGLAAAGVPPTSTITVDLETGARVETVLLDEAGDPTAVSPLYPEEGGAVGYSVAGFVGRWEGDTLVEKVDLRGVSTGARFADWWAIVLQDPESFGNSEVAMVDLTPGALDVAYRLALPDTIAAHPTADGGIHAIDANGILRTYTADGAVVAEVATSMTFVSVLTLDEISGKLAIGGRTDLDRAGVVVVDPFTGEMDQITDDEVDSLGFARAGALLAITAVDGTVRLWDMERSRSAGVVWDGSGATSGLPSWYDAEAETIWVSTSGKVVEIPVNPDRWIEWACEIVGRDFTPDEWAEFVPGNQPLRSACP